jgi:carboxylesterase type B
MVYIHGGGFYIGSGNAQMHGPGPMMNTGEVVLVTMNYRLGVLGNRFNKTNYLHVKYRQNKRNFILNLWCLE